jgi:hypothetical protein
LRDARTVSKRFIVSKVSDFGESVVVTVTAAPVVASRMKIIAASAIVIYGPVSVDENRIVAIIVASG